MTDQTTNTAKTLAATLTAGEVQALKEVEAGKQLDYPMWQALSDKGLIVVTHDQKYNRKDVLTPLGRQVLEALEAAPTATAALEQARSLNLSATVSATTGKGYGIPEITIADLIKEYRKETQFLSDGRSHIGNILCDIVECQAVALEQAQAREKALRVVLETCTTSKVKAMWLGAQAFDLYRRATSGETLWGGLTDQERKAWIDVGSKIPSIALIKADNTPEAIIPTGGVIPIWLEAAAVLAQGGEA